MPMFLTYNDKRLLANLKFTALIKHQAVRRILKIGFLSL